MPHPVGHLIPAVQSKTVDSYVELRGNRNDEILVSFYDKTMVFELVPIMETQAILFLMCARGSFEIVAYEKILNTRNYE